MPSCIVRGCSNRSSNKSQEQLTKEFRLKRNTAFYKYVIYILFYIIVEHIFNLIIIIVRFPRDFNMRSKWIAAVRNINITETTRICSDHFSKECYIKNAKCRMKLLPTACPTTNPCQDHNAQLTTFSPGIDNQLPSIYQCKADIVQKETLTYTNIEYLEEDDCTMGDIQASLSNFNTENHQVLGTTTTTIYLLKKVIS